MSARVNLLNLSRLAQIVALVLVTLSSATRVASAEDTALSPSIDASFKCDAARSKSEKLICSDDRLRLQDQQLDKAYRKALSTLSVDEQYILRQQEADWLSFRSSQCALLDGDRAPMAIIDDQVTCFRNATDWRIQTLSLEEMSNANSPVAIERNIPPFKPTKVPFTPVLLEEHDPKVCRIFLSAVRNEYFSKRAQNYAPSIGDPNIDGGVWLPTGTYTVSLDGGTDRQLISFTQYLFGHFGVAVRLLIRDGSEVNALDVKSLESGAPLENLQRGWKVVLDRQGSVFEPLYPSVLWFRGGLYMLLRSNVDGSNPINVQPHAVVLAKIRKGGGLTPICTTSVSPPDIKEHSTSDNPEVNAPTPPRSLIRLHDSVDILRGDGVRCVALGPGLGGFYNLERNSGTTLGRALNQPWTLFNGYNDHHQASVDSATEFLRLWGYESLSSYRVSRSIFELRKTAQMDLINYYINTFGVGDRAADSTATQAVDYILLSGLLIHGPYPTRADTDLRRAVLLAQTDYIERLDGNTILDRDNDVKQEIDAPTNSTYLQAGREEVGEPILFYALENVSVAKLLVEKHVDVNARNWFGKTALMYAAQFDLANMVDFLLTHGANVNFSTPQTDFCNAPRITGRTALMYAAENGSPTVIKRLLEAGADTHAVDSEHRDIANYLSRNDHIDPTERAELERSLH